MNTDLRILERELAEFQSSLDILVVSWFFYLS